ncbi:HWE histidine kinase domain-containing protein [uncultured Rhizobium sp.]|nr:HWE histidine kinase domain-containing protein [uncultured Rhizobium sp.]MBN8954189.1 PAS domain-containing protein [Rhizobium tropici]OJY70918.1 MAG: hypothetical protein BGP09_04370 [Rhizobium sp. 60-20]
MSDSSDVVYRMSPDWREMRYLQGKDFIADTDNPSESWLQRYIHPDDQEMITTAVTIAIANKTVFELEHRVIRVDGSLGWTHSRAIPILDGNGEIVEWFGAAHDVSDRKQSEQTQQLLLNELNHRVKNTLASVHAIAQQTLRTSPDPSAFATGFSGRLQALSRVHTLLTSSNWEGAELHAIVRDQLSIGATGDDRITVIGPPARLNPQASQHMAMILHELGTNSLKYGALSNATGLVSLGWSLRDARLHLDWREKAGPPIKTPLGRGFGTRFIETVAKGEGGTAMMSIEDGGLNWEIVLPLASANASFASSSNSPADRAHPETATQIQLPTISGKTFAIIEDEPLIAFNIASILEQEGARVAGPALSVTDALRLIEVSELDGALLDANLRGDGVGDVAAALIRRNIPFAFVTGYGREALPAKFASARLLTKPFTEQQLLKTAIEIVDQDDSVLRYRASGRE